jgi:outer membrane protein assembly factor BamB
MGAEGLFTCLEAKTGALVWQKDLRQVADRAPPMWGFSSSPLVVGQVVVVQAGGPGDKGVLAFNVESGDLAWSAECGEDGYSSPQLCNILGEDTIVVISKLGMTLLDPVNGKIRLDYDWKIEGYRSLQPQMIDDKSILIPSGMGFGTRLVQFEKVGDNYSTKDLWTSRKLKPDFNDFVIYQGHAYGFDALIFTCIDLATGEAKWKGGRYGKGQVLLVEDSGLMLVASEQGELVLVKADPAKHSELGSIKAIEGRTWNHPVLIGNRLYIRNSQEAACYELPTVSAAVVQLQ